MLVVAVSMGLGVVKCVQSARFSICVFHNSFRSRRLLCFVPLPSLRCLFLEPANGKLKTPAGAEILFGSGPKIPVNTKKYVEWGLGRGESDYESYFWSSTQERRVIAFRS